MCGIIAYVGKDNAMPYLVMGIKKLEYRGYDSAGCAYMKDGELVIKKDIGSASALIKRYRLSHKKSSIGMFHTRWATQGAIEHRNAHPQIDCNCNIAVVHNGIIENSDEFGKLVSSHTFYSDTDTEVIAHAIEKFVEKGMRLEDAAIEVYKIINGASSFTVMQKGINKIVAVKKGTPLVLGLGKNGTFISSDVPAFSDYSDKVVYLHDGDIVTATPNGYKINCVKEHERRHPVVKITQGRVTEHKQKKKHIMLEEIMEQIPLIRKFGSRNFNPVKRVAKMIKNANNIYLVGCGSSFYAARFGADVLISSGKMAIATNGEDFVKYRNFVRENDVAIFISQSGETGDIVSNFDYYGNCRKVGLINVRQSFLARNVDINIELGVGEERAVASTKSFVMSLMYLILIAAETRNEFDAAMQDLKVLNLNMYNLLVPSVNKKISEAAQVLSTLKNITYVGTGFDLALAQEGALKMKEISYINSEAIDLPSFKHGPLALVDQKFYGVAIISGQQRNSVKSGISEIKTRKGKIIGISQRPDKDYDIFIRSISDGMFEAVPLTILLQLLAYKVALFLKREIDRPRNLAKSITTR